MSTLNPVPPFPSAPEIPLWSGPAPESIGSTSNDIPRLYAYLPTEAMEAGSAIIIMPGGGYGMLAFEHEGINEAQWFQERGVAAFILFYRLPTNGYRHPVPLMDAQRAVRLIRSRAAEWKINPAKIAVMGFSAGGHLAATLETRFDASNETTSDPVDRFSSRPDFVTLVYALISMQEGRTHAETKRNLLGPDPAPALVETVSCETQVSSLTPPTNLVHAVDDAVVPIEQSRLMLAALQHAGVPCRLDEYPTGRHGFGYGPKQKNAPAGWLDRALDWLKAQGFGVV